jgi:hypothetical protein
MSVFSQRLMEASKYAFIGTLLLLFGILSLLCDGVSVGKELNFQRSMPISYFRCGGELESKTWKLWDDFGKSFLERELIQSRLMNQGDSYALYDIEGYFHNLVEMADRCTRVERAREIGDILILTYDQLENSHGAAQWICRGGAICNEANGLINKEVMLVSIQGLGLMSSVARRLSNSIDLNSRNHPFVRKTASVLKSHLDRWGDAKAILRWQEMLSKSPSDASDGRVGYLFTDKDAWFLEVSANFSGICTAFDKPTPDPDATDYCQTNNLLNESVFALMKLFVKRTIVEEIPKGNLDANNIAELDKGFWRYFPDNRYAGYTGSTSPVPCVGGSSDESKKVINDFFERDVGWDISHSSRLVHLIQALVENWEPMKKFYHLDGLDLEPSFYGRAFSEQLIERVWNRDDEFPLFSNYWSGDNGWYRVSYKNGTGRCYGGYGPFKLSEAFITGGYVSWEIYNSFIGRLGRQIFETSRRSDQKARDYIKNFYPGLQETDENKHLLTELMFWPSLVEQATP